MIAPSLHRAPLWALAALLFLAPPMAADSEWSGEIGLLIGNHDNFFFRGAGNAAPSSDLLSGYVTAERSQDWALGEWTFGMAASMVAVADIDDADYQSLGLLAEYKRGPWKAALGYEQLLNRLYSESGEAVFFDQVAWDLWLRYSVNRRVWVRLRTETEDWDFDDPQNDRDSDGNDYALTVRVAATERVALRVSALLEKRDAVGPENNRSGQGAEIAFEGTPREDLTWFLRYRSRDRDYEDAPTGDSNFQRSDSVEDVSFNVRWSFAEGLGLMLRDTYRSGDSTRADRNFSGNVLEVGVYFQFGSAVEEP